MNVLIAVEDGMSLCTFNNTAYPIAKINENAIVVCHNEKTANNIALRTGGDVVETPEAEFSYEVRIKIESFDKIVHASNWVEIIKKHIVKEE